MSKISLILNFFTVHHHIWVNNGLEKKDILFWLIHELHQNFHIFGLQCSKPGLGSQTELDFSLGSAIV
jgi:hypothetical protein